MILIKTSLSRFMFEMLISDCNSDVKSKQEMNRDQKSKKYVHSLPITKRALWKCGNL